MNFRFLMFMIVLISWLCLCLTSCSTLRPSLPHRTPATSTPSPSDSTRDCPFNLIDVLAPGEELLSPSASIALAVTLAEDLLKKKGNTSEQIVTPKAKFDSTHLEEINVTGVSGKIRKLSPEEVERTVFRHYANNAETATMIQETKTLISSFAPYIEVAPGVFRKYHDALTGIFLTSPETPDFVIGVERGIPINLKINSNIPVIEIEKGRVYLIPAYSRVRAHTRTLYSSLKSGEPLNEFYRKSAEALLEKYPNGLPQISQIPIEIISE